MQRHVTARATGAAKIVIVTICALVSGGVRANASDDDSPFLPVTVERVLAVWSQHEAQLRSFRATWIHERTYTRYWAHCHVPSARDEYVTLRFADSVLTIDGDRMRFDSGPVDSSGDAVETAGDPQFDAQGRLLHDDAHRVFRDDRVRYDRGRRRVDPREVRQSRWPRNLRAFTAVSADDSHWQFLPAERGEYPEACLFANAPADLRASLHVQPLIAAVRPSWLGLSPAQCRLGPDSHWFKGTECRVLVDETGLPREFWLDVERDFSPVSVRMDCDVLGARMKNRIDIDYYRTSDGHWLPSGWTTVFFDNYGLMEQYAAATVLSVESNPAISGQDFELAPPPGTWVYDESARTHAIVSDDGRAAPISDGELRAGLTHAELAARGT